MAVINRGFAGRGKRNDALPPGQYLTDGFPVLSAGPTPRVDTDKWQFSIIADGQRHEWSWSQLQMLPSESVTVDIHCVTKWSKLDTAWPGVSVDTLVDLAGHVGPFALPTTLPGLAALG